MNFFNSINYDKIKKYFLILKLHLFNLHMLGGSKIYYAPLYLLYLLQKKASIVELVFLLKCHSTYQKMYLYFVSIFRILSI